MYITIIYIIKTIEYWYNTISFSSRKRRLKRLVEVSNNRYYWPLVISGPELKERLKLKGFEWFNEGNISIMGIMGIFQLLSH